MISGIPHKKQSHQPALVTVLMVFAFALAGCKAAPLDAPLPTATLPALPTAAPTELVLVQNTQTVPSTAEVAPAATESVGYDPTNPDSWKDLPVIPLSISQRMRDLYASGKASGLNQRAFSKVGDCETSSEYFLAPFDMNERGYRLGEYSSLKSMIEKYAGSFERRSLAAKSSFSAASILAPVWADATLCKSGESPLVCEIRVHKPALMLVMVGTNDVKSSSLAGFETNLKNLLNIAIANNIVPVLVTKADNLEGDGSYNAIIARVAFEYEIPLMNFWRAMQEVPDNGLEADQIHLTYAQPFFDSPENMQKGWPVRNLTALQILAFLQDQLER